MTPLRSPPSSTALSRPELSPPPWSSFFLCGDIPRWAWGWRNSLGMVSGP